MKLELSSSGINDERALHMSSVPEINAALISTLVAAVLQTNYTLPSPQLLLGEVAYIFVCFFRPDAWLPEVARLENMIPSQKKVGEPLI